MILYRSPTIFGRLILKRWNKVRGSNKNARRDFKKYRKLWWHFKTRWDTNDTD